MTYFGNEIYAMDLELEDLVRLTDPAIPLADPTFGQSELFPFDGTQPNIRHTFDGLAFIEHADRAWAFSGALASLGGWADDVTWTFNPADSSWQRLEPTGTTPEPELGIVSAYDPVTGKVFLHNRHGLYSYEWDSSGGVYTRHNGDGWMQYDLNGVVDPIRRKFLIIGRGDQHVYDIAPGSAYVRQALPPTGDTEFLPEQGPGLAYDPVADRIVAWAGGNLVYSLDVDTGTWTGTAFKNGPGPAHSQGTYGRWAYIPDLDAYVVYNAVDDNAFTFKPPRGIEDTEPPLTPPNLTATAILPDKVELSWDEPDDNFGTLGYRIIRDGAEIADIRVTEYSDLGLVQNTEYTYDVYAYDSAGNESLVPAVVIATTPSRTVQLPLGDCGDEPALIGRTDVVFCEPWESTNWWENGYLREPVLLNPWPALLETVENTTIVSSECISGSCLKISMDEGQSRSLSIFWPLLEAEMTPEELYLRYYLKLGPNWDAFQCDWDGSLWGDGGKFPGLADIRTGHDPVGQCGDSSGRGDGINCWSGRTAFQSCDSDDGLACITKPGASARLGVHLYHYDQTIYNTGDLGLWDADDFAQTTGDGGSCQTTPNNMDCGIGDAGVIATDEWHAVEMQIKMNTPGAADGIIRGWVDGVLGYEKTNTIFRLPDHDGLHNRLLWLDVYKGGTRGNCTSSEIYLDQLAIARDAPVGPFGGVTELPPVLTLSASATEVETGEQALLSWESHYANSCTASGDWQGDRPLAGDEWVGPLQNDSLFSLTCTGDYGSATQEVQITVTEPVVDLGPPTVPQDLTATLVTSDEIRFSWSPSSDDIGVAGYRVFDDQQQLIAEVATTAYSDSGLQPATPYTYFVAAFDAAGHVSALSDPLVVTTAELPDTLTLTPVADTYLDPTTYRSLGDWERLHVSTSRRMLLRFDLSAIPPGTTISSASLELYDYAKYGTLGGVGVFRATQDWVEGSYAAVDGATANYYDRATGLLWDNFLGDWQDANGVDQGDAAYDLRTLVDDDTPSWEAWDVTTLVQDWTDGAYPNQGLLLRNLFSGDTHTFRSREYSDSTYWPRLVITLQTP